MSDAGSCACGPDAHVDDCEGGSLRGAVDLDRVTCANEAVRGRCRAVFKPLDARRDHADERTLTSCAGDRELLLTIPFTSPCRVRSVCVSGPAGAQPGSARLFVNRDDLDLASAGDAAPAQELALPLDAYAELWHPLRAVKFGAVSTLVVHLDGVAGGGGDGDASAVWFVGLKGTASGLRRGAVTAVYEARAMPADHPAARATAGGGIM